MHRRKMTARTKQRLFSLVLMSTLITILFAALLAPTALARTYVIRDGERVITYTSFETDPAQVLDEAGLDLGEYDSYTTEPLEEGEAIFVQRGQNITIVYHGKTTVVTSFGETVGELLLRLNLTVTGEDVVSHDMDEQTYDGMELWIDRKVTVSEVYSKAVAHDVRYCADASVPVGTEEILIRGQDGELLCSADVTYVNGREVAREVREETVTQMPVTQIVGIGTGRCPEPGDPQAMPEIGDGYIRLPTGEVLTYSDTGTVRATAYTHTDEGCDFDTATGTIVHRGTVAVDPRYIPYGTRMFIVSNDGAYICGICVAEDCGGDIKGDRMDIYFPTYEECRQFGRRVCTIYYLS